MNRQLSQQSHNSSGQLFYSQYLKQQSTPTDEVTELKRKCEMLTRQLEIKEEFINQIQTQTTKQQKLIKQQQNQLKEQQILNQNLMIENSILVKENQSLKLELSTQEISTQDKTVNKFVTSIIDLVYQCQPQSANGTQNKPNLKQCWKWLKQVLNDYIYLKQKQG